MNFPQRWDLCLLHLSNPNPKKAKQAQVPVWPPWKEAGPLRAGGRLEGSLTELGKGQTQESRVRSMPLPYPLLFPTSFEVKRAKGGRARRPLCLQSG